MPKRKPVLWCRPLVGSQYLDVWITDEEACPHLKGAEAVFRQEEAFVAMCRHLADERKEDCFGHEVLIHGILEIFGIDRRIREEVGLTEKQWNALNEILAESYGPALMGTLKANGMLKMPKLPKAARFTPRDSQPPGAIATKQSKRPGPRKAAKR